LELDFKQEQRILQLKEHSVLHLPGQQLEGTVLQYYQEQTVLL
jgi:hypothetical protein